MCTLENTGEKSFCKNWTLQNVGPRRCAWTTSTSAKPAFRTIAGVASPKMCTLENTGKHVCKTSFHWNCRGYPRAVHQKAEHYTKTWDCCNPPRHASWKPLGRPVFLTKPGFRKIVWVGWISSESWTLQNVGFFRTPPRCALWKTLGKQVVLQARFPEKIVALTPKGSSENWPLQNVVFFFLQSPNMRTLENTTKQVFVLSQLSRKMGYPKDSSESWTLQNVGFFFAIPEMCTLENTGKKNSFCKSWTTKRGSPKMSTLEKNR